MRQATDGHAVPDLKTLHLHFWHPPDITREIFQDIMPEIALLDALYHCDFESQSIVLFDTYSAVSLLLLLYCSLFFLRILYREAQQNIAVFLQFRCFECDDLTYATHL